MFQDTISETVTQVSCLTAQCKVLGSTYLIIELFSKKHHFRVETQYRVLKDGIAHITDTVNATFNL